jgi:hypothetical protein
MEIQVEPHHATTSSGFDVEASYLTQSPFTMLKLMSGLEGSEYVESCCYFKFGFCHIWPLNAGPDNIDLHYSVSVV